MTRSTSPLEKPKRSRARHCAVAKGSAPLTFEQGYVCAVATLLRQHGETTIAKDVMGCMPNVDWSKIDPFDKEAFAEYGLLPNSEIRHEPPSAQEK